MKLKSFALSAAIILFTSVTSHAGHGFLTGLMRNCGYGYSDGYHAQRYCLPDYTSCSSCSPVQQPMIPQPMMQPMMQQPLAPQPIMQQQAMFPQPMMQQRPVMQQPMTAPGYPQRLSPQLQQTGYAVGYPVTQPYQSWHQPYVRAYGQPAAPAAAIPQQGPAPW